MAMRRYTRNLIGALLVLGASLASAQMTGLGGTFPRLEPEDLRRMQEAARAGLDGAAEGTRRSWENPETRARGEVELLRSFRRDGRSCRLVLHRLVLSGQEPWVFRSTLCRTPEGGWQVLEQERPHPSVPELHD